MPPTRSFGGSGGVRDGLCLRVFQPSGALGGLLSVAAVGVIFFGLVPTPLIEAARRAAASLLL